MRKVPLVLSFLLVFCLFSFISATRASADNKIMVGVFYYPWYLGGNGTGHWNGNATEADSKLPYSWWNVTDEPYLLSRGTHWYASNDTEVIKQHLDWFKYAGINFGIISWWGLGGDKIAFDDAWVYTLLNYTKHNSPWFRWVISIEGDCYNAADKTNSTIIQELSDLREYIIDNYIGNFSDIWLNDAEGGKPYLFWMNGDDLGNYKTDAENVSDTRVVTKILGQSSYVDWTTWVPYRGNTSTTPFSPSNGFMCVMPRYDESRLDPENKTGNPPRNIICDPRLDGSAEGNETPTDGIPLYDKQWKDVMSYRKELKLVAIATWNDFTERTQIEPCNDSTSAYKDDPFFLLNRTKYWISILKDTEAPTISELSQFPPENVTEDQNVTISVNVSDIGSGVNRVLLNWTTNVTNGASFVPMAFNFGSDLYEGVIPGQKAGTSVNYSITAYDGANNCRVDDNQTYYYNYAVTPEFSPLLVFPLFMFTTLAAAIVYKRKGTHSAQKQNLAG